MDLKRLPITRFNNKVCAMYEGRAFTVLNADEVPEAFTDGIFLLDYAQGVATFESRQADLSYVTVRGLKNRNDSAAPQKASINGTTVIHLLDGKVSAILSPDHVVVDAAALQAETKTLIAALALEGYDLADPRFSKVLRYILK